MTPLERKRKELEIQRVQTACMDLELKIMELTAEILRVEGHMETSMATLEKLKSDLKGE